MFTSLSQRPSTVFQDHIVSRGLLLPGVAFLEMAFSAMLVGATTKVDLHMIRAVGFV